MLLMEDLSALTLGDQAAGVSPEQARAALVALAAHHARFWNCAGLDDADFIPVINGPLNQIGGAVYEASLPGFMAAFGDAILPELRDYVDGYAARRPEILEQLAAMPHTLVHFDFRADNLFFDDDGSIAVVDWQTISQGGGVADVGYFLSQNLSTDDRRAHEADLLRAYHDALVANGVTGYSYEQLRRRLSGRNRLRLDHPGARRREPRLHERARGRALDLGGRTNPERPARPRVRAHDPERASGRQGRRDHRRGERHRCRHRPVVRRRGGDGGGRRHAGRRRPGARRRAR